MDLIATASPNPHHRRRDVETGGERRSDGEASSPSGAFDIPRKGAPIERLKRWRQAALVLNASRRFRYTLDLKKEEEKEQIRRKIRAHAQAIRAAVMGRQEEEMRRREKEMEEMERMRSKIRAYAQLFRAALLFEEAGKKEKLAF